MLTKYADVIKNRLAIYFVERCIKCVAVRIAQLTQCSVCVVSLRPQTEVRRKVLIRDLTLNDLPSVTNISRHACL